MTGFDTPHQERCVGTRMTMKMCTIEGCSTMVHPFCHIDWLSMHFFTRLLLVTISAGSTAIVIKPGCASDQVKFRVFKMDVSQDQPRQPIRKSTEDSVKTYQLLFMISHSFCIFVLTECVISTSGCDMKIW